jgi:ascorbate-specific PTS system EIIC-type component UlaA
MKITTISYFIGGVGFVFIGLSIVPVSGFFSAIVGVIILAVGAFLIWAGYRDYKNVKRQVNEWR